MKTFKLFIISILLLLHVRVYATTSIVANSAFIDNVTNIATYTGDVEFRDEEMVINANKIIVKSISKLDKTYHITATNIKDNVALSMSQEDISASAKTIIYNTDTGVILLKNDAVMNQDGNVLTGENITYSVDTDTANVERGKDDKVRFELDL